MITPALLEQVENYLERHCLDKRWLDYREQLGKPVDLHKNSMQSLQNLISQLESGTGRTPETDILLAGYVEATFSKVPMGNKPRPIIDAERAKMFETHRNYFANCLFALMEQKFFTEDALAAKARLDAAIFDKLRNERKYFPAERTIWALMFGLELTFDEANSLLHRAKFFLDAVRQEEVLIAFFLDKRIYDLPTIDEVLQHYGFETLAVHEDFSPSHEKIFRDDELIARIDLYIDENFYDTSWILEQTKRGAKFSYSLEPLGEPAESIKTFEGIVRKLKDKIGIAGNFFSDYLFKLIKQKNLSDVEVYKRAHLDRRIFSKIRNEKNYMPAKKTVLAIAFAMRLNFKETNTLLERAGYSLSESRKEDVVAAYFIDNQIYDLFLINEVLDYYDCPTLGD